MNKAVIGVQWGDEGKGKVVDAFTADADVVVRYGGGANAGHTVYIGDQRFVLHVVPSGALHPGKKCVNGNGCAIDPLAFLDDMNHLPVKHGDVFVSDRAHVVLPKHIEEDKEREKVHKIGSTQRGMSPAYRDKALRVGLRFCDPEWGAHFDPKVFPEVMKYVRDTRVMLQEALERNESILFEGAQGSMLDVDHGTYPYITSSTTTVGGVYAGTGINPKVLKVIGVAKAYTTRVGEGPFPTELKDDLGERLRTVGKEFGATTGRPRRCGWFDAVVVKYSCEVNGVDEVALTKLDILTGLDELRIATKYYKIEMTGENAEFKTIPSRVKDLEQCIPRYVSLKGWKDDLSTMRRFEDLPQEAKDYVCFIEAVIGRPIRYVGVGQERSQILEKKK